MSLQSTYDEQVSAMATMLAQQVGSLDDATLAKRPGPALNPIGFIQWHILRIWDLDLNLLIKGGAPETDAWHRGGYGDEIGYEPIEVRPAGRDLASAIPMPKSTLCHIAPMCCPATSSSWSTRRSPTSPGRPTRTCNARSSCVASQRPLPAGCNTSSRIRGITSVRFV